MQYRRVRTILGQVIGGPVVKANADGKNHVRVVHGHVGFIGAVHPQHPQRLRVCRRESAKSHQG